MIPAVGSDAKHPLAPEGDSLQQADSRAVADATGLHALSGAPTAHDIARAATVIALLGNGAVAVAGGAYLALDCSRAVARPASDIYRA